MGQRLVEICPNLLKVTCKVERAHGGEEQLTPLQHFAEQRSNLMKPFKEGDDQSLKAKLEELEARLKRQCLVTFDNATCKCIMYRKGSGELGCHSLGLLQRTPSVSAGLEAGFGPAKATMGYTWELKKTQMIQGHSSVVGSRHSLGQAGTSGRPRVKNIFWGLYENPQTNSGIPSFMQTAVLLKGEGVMGASHGQTFSAELTIGGTVETHGWVKDKWASFERKMSSKRKKEGNVIFIPEKNTGFVRDADNLMKVDLNTYKQLVTIRQWENGDEKPREYGSAYESAHQEATEKQEDTEKQEEMGKLLTADLPDAMPQPSIEDATPHAVLDTDPGGKSLTSKSVLETEVSAAIRNIAQSLTPHDADAVGDCISKH